MDSGAVAYLRGWNDLGSGLAPPLTRALPLLHIPRPDPEHGRTAPELQSKSRHAHLASLGSYVRLGSETSARVTAEHDPASRRLR